MEINLEILCSKCNDRNRKRIVLEQSPKDYYFIEIWIECDCGNKEYMCDAGDTVG